MVKRDETAAGIIEAVRAIEEFTGAGLTKRIGELEHALQECDADACRAHGSAAGISSELLGAAYMLKRAAGQINVLIHAVAVLLLVPKITRPGERIVYLSLGAGNTGRNFDVETTLRVAEFKFIHWQGRDTIRQNALFKDFYDLAEYETPKAKELYVLETKRPMKFLRGGRAIRSVLSRNVKLLADFRTRYGDRFTTVGDYYKFKASAVNLVDASLLLPELAQVASAMDEETATDAL